MFDFSKVFSYNYIFEYIPQWDSEISWILWLIFAGIFVVGLAIWAYDKLARKNKFFTRHLKDRILPLTNTIAITGVVLTFFRWQAIPYLSSRLLVYILIGVGTIWTITILIYFLRKYPQEKMAAKIALRKEKYLKQNKKSRKSQL